MEDRLDKLAVSEVAYMCEGLLQLSSTGINLKIDKQESDLNARIVDALSHHVEELNKPNHPFEINEHSIKVLQNIASYLAYQRTNKAISTLNDLVPMLQNNLDVIKDPSVIHFSI